jgi:4-hydroxybenzoate polyprenyltransferase
MNSNPHIDLLTVIGANVTALTINNYNAVLGTISLIVSISYTLFRFYKDFKQK